MPRLVQHALFTAVVITSSLAHAALSETVQGTGYGSTASAAIAAAQSSAANQCAQRALAYEAASYSVSHGSYSANGPMPFRNPKVWEYQANGTSTCTFTFRR